MSVILIYTIFINSNGKLTWEVLKCGACGACTSECPVNAINFEDDILRIIRDSCIQCSNLPCVTACPSGALTFTYNSGDNQ
jgi:ferredoxin